eukprot:TRINITY_DN10441_c0_g1_i2.p1 TRINITY_DN10441_c0_g1~~TRINITY_DN10441_c0_g1_i2.p1  ORF type:complete len:418 (+),score=114.16 TRINITY_DN10441_c0_g1_i2:68-1321(+)
MDATASEELFDRLESDYLSVVHELANRLQQQNALHLQHEQRFQEGSIELDRILHEIAAPKHEKHQYSRATLAEIILYMNEESESRRAQFTVSPSTKAEQPDITSQRSPTENTEMPLSDSIAEDLYEENLRLSQILLELEQQLLIQEGSHTAVNQQEGNPKDADVAYEDTIAHQQEFFDAETVKLEQELLELENEIGRAKNQETEYMNTNASRSKLREQILLYEAAIKEKEQYLSATSRQLYEMSQSLDQVCEAEESSYMLVIDLEKRIEQERFIHQDLEQQIRLMEKQVKFDDDGSDLESFRVHSFQSQKHLLAEAESVRTLYESNSAVARRMLQQQKKSLEKENNQIVEEADRIEQQLIELDQVHAQEINYWKNAWVQLYKELEKVALTRQERTVVLNHLQTIGQLIAQHESRKLL